MRRDVSAGRAVKSVLQVTAQDTGQSRNGYDRQVSKPQPDALGDRIKAYEAHETSRRFLPRLPVVARLDGRSFSTFTQGMGRPFDDKFAWLMRHVAEYVLDESDARVAYTQSDEVSPAWEQPDDKSQIFFNATVFKMTSVLAALVTAKFVQHAVSLWPDRVASALPTFDCRVFQVPTRDEAANALLWREQDATKNAITQAAQCYYSHEDLHGKSGKEKQEMLFAKGVNFNDYPDSFKRGTWLRREPIERMLTDEELARIPEAHRPTGPIQRHQIRVLEMPPFARVANRAAVIFDGAQPQPFE